MAPAVSLPRRGPRQAPCRGLWQGWALLGDLGGDVVGRGRAPDGGRSLVTPVTQPGPRGRGPTAPSSSREGSVRVGSRRHERGYVRPPALFRREGCSSSREGAGLPGGLRAVPRAAPGPRPALLSSPAELSLWGRAAACGHGRAPQPGEQQTPRRSSPGPPAPRLGLSPAPSSAGGHPEGDGPPPLPSVLGPGRRVGWGQGDPRRPPAGPSCARRAAGRLGGESEPALPEGPRASHILALLLQNLFQLVRSQQRDAAT